MAAESKGESCFDPMDEKKQCCRMESIVSVDERGQMVLPKQVRDKANIHAGDKLAIVTWEKEGEICCIFLIKTGDFAGMVKDLLGPLVKEMVEK